MKRGRKNRIILLLVFILIGAGLGTYVYSQWQKNSKKVVSDNINNDQAAKKDNTNIKNVKNDEEVKKEQEKQKETANNAEGSKDDSNKQTTNNDGKVTQDKAIEIVSKYVNSKNQGAKFTFDHIQKRENVDYYVIRAYVDMSDHIATLGWYYVDVNNGKAFEWDLLDDKLVPLK